jgi:hypothetical protein
LALYIIASGVVDDFFVFIKKVAGQHPKVPSLGW